MLTIELDEIEVYDEKELRFFVKHQTSITLVHNLYAISKWEAKFKKPFLSDLKKTDEEIFFYINCMSDEELSIEDLSRFTKENFLSINRYLEDTMTATTFRDKTSGSKKEIITSEIIYYWMITFNIPFECQFWHINRLLTLIRVCSEKNNNNRNMTQNEIAKQNTDLNKLRREALNTKG